MTQPAIHQAHRELKYRVDEDEAARLEALFGAHIPLRPRFTGERQTVVRGVYLDFADRSLTRRSLESPQDCQKVRYRRYEPPFRRTATTQPSVVVWLEVKTRQGEQVSKERVSFKGPLLPGLLGGTLETPADAVILRALLARGRMEPVVAVTYRRTAFERPDESLRLTIDRDVAFQVPSYVGDLSDDVGRLSGCVVEVKASAAVPEWLEEALGGHARSALSKFEAAARAIGLDPGTGSGVITS
jgi:VTC domain-containing protein